MRKKTTKHLPQPQFSRGETVHVSQLKGERRISSEPLWNGFTWMYLFKGEGSFGEMYLHKVDVARKGEVVKQAQSAVHESESRCLRALKSLIEAMNYGHSDETLGRKGAARIIAEYYGDSDSEEADFTIQEGLDALQAYNDAHNAFLDAVRDYSQSQAV